MTKELIVNSTRRETKVALLEDGVVAELFIEREAHRGVVGNIYKGRVTRVVPGMQSAFVALGLERDAFLYVADVFEEWGENLLTPEEQAESAGNGGGNRHGPIEERLREALSGSCGVVNPAAPCRCHRRLARAAALGRVVPGEVTTEVPLDVAALREQRSRIEEARRVAAYYQADPASRPRRDLVRAALQPFTSTRSN